MARLTRRGVLGGGVALASAGVAAAAIAQTALAAPATPEADAELIALCERFIELERQKIASYDREPPGLTPEEENAIDQRERQPIWEKQTVLVDAIFDARATTLNGFRARARALVTYDQEGWKNKEISHGPFPGGMNFALVRDLIGEAG